MTWPPRRILVGTDFSPSAGSALRAAAALARRVHATLDVVHVLPDATSGAREAALTRLESLVREAAPPGSEGLVLKGDPLPELVAHRDRGDFDLVALGAGHMRGMRRFILGSVAGKMLGHPGCPLLLVAEAPAAGEFKRILIAQENPRATSPWLEIGLRIAHDERSEITLLHVLPRLGYLSDSHRVELEPESAPAHLSGLLARLDRTVPAKVIVRRGDPSHEIALAARELESHLLVLGAERGLDGDPGHVVSQIARSGPPAFLVVWPEPESSEDFSA